MTSPKRALDPAVMLATSLHAAPGVYALLLGSGVSTGAGIPTGWGVVRELVRRAAAATDPNDATAANRAANDPAAWWAIHGDGERLGYSNLLASLAPSASARRALLAGFFEPTDDDIETGLKMPNVAHHAIAQMAKRGIVRVIITTNFDRLIERALEDVGLPPQTVSRAEAVDGLTPLAHAPVTVVKLHGDYADLEMRNTIDELEAYPPEWDQLLDRIFEDYGLLISGWSGAWDTALVGALQRSRSRRYPLYWDGRSSKGDAAVRLLAQHRGVIVPSGTADDLFEGLVERLDALDRLSEPPLTGALAVARLKRYLPDPTRRIDVHDLMTSAVQQVVEVVAQQPLHRDGLTVQDIVNVLDDAKQSVLPVLGLLINGAYFDRSRDHLDLWIDAIQRLLRARGKFSGSFNDNLDRARHYPALLAYRSAGIVAVVTGRDDVLLRLATEPVWRDPYRSNARIQALHVLHDHRVVESDVINVMSRWNGQRWLYPQSHLLRDELREPLREILPDDEEYAWANDRYEYRIALAQMVVTKEDVFSYRSAPGEFIGEWKWDRHTGQPTSEIEFRDIADRSGDEWPWWPFLSGREGLDGTLTSLREDLAKLQKWG
jgi:hypothetical protein